MYTTFSISNYTIFFQKSISLDITIEFHEDNKILWCFKRNKFLSAKTAATEICASHQSVILEPYVGTEIVFPDNFPLNAGYNKLVKFYV